jgi:hypothetical protein
MPRFDIDHCLAHGMRIYLARQSPQIGDVVGRDVVGTSAKVPRLLM